MAAFSPFEHHHTFLLDSSVFLPNSPSTINVNNNNNLDDPNSPCLIPQFYQIEKKPHQNLDQISTKVMSSGPCIINEASVVSLTNKNSTTIDSSSIVTENKYDIQSCDQVITQKVNNTNMDKKRKYKEGSSANSAQSKDKREVKEKKQKNMKSNVEENMKEAEKEAPKGYIHVRARRGQATDSHSLAERVRREKISERMKLLQAIVPGCDKVTGKALMLDEIINYVQSLQNQVEFLSMKLASVNPMYYDFGMDLESFMVRPDQDLSNLPSPLPSMQDLSNLPSPLPSMQECSPTTAINYPLLDNSANSFLFQHAQIPNVLLQAGGRQTLWELDELRHRNTNESGIEQQPVFFPLI